MGDLETTLWTVFRMDDHGNSFVVETRLKKKEAENLVVEYSGRGHKQGYWLEPHIPKHDDPPSPYI